MSNPPITRKKLSGSQYRKIPEEREKKEEEVLKKVRRISYYFQKQSVNIPVNEISAIVLDL